MTLFQIVFIPLCLFFLYRTLRKGRSGRLLRWQAATIALVWLMAALLIAVPESSNIIAGWLGIGRGSDLIFYLALIFGLQAAVFFYNRYRRLEGLVTELVRREALQHARRGGEREGAA